ncbi:ubiquitin 3 binding protein But2 C-terminal domain-containing protein [Dipodascopsis tothii]|uniref:ubiquitin 3 binding protein But2 C-terminal domain-containing protein n=1 Tax=Dipodascopsis tothii TaxID=44089 RepID=UPI0034CFA854
MHFTTSALAASVLAALAPAVLAAPLQARGEKTFGVVTIHSGSDLQYASLGYGSGNTISVGSGSGIDFYVSGGHLKDTKGNTFYVDASTRQIKYAAKDIPSSGVQTTWSTSSTSLELDSKANGIACKTSGGYELYWAKDGEALNCDGALGVDLYVSYDPAATTSATKSPTKTATATPAKKTAATPAAASTATILPPNLLIPVEAATPTKAFGAQYTGDVKTANGKESVGTFVSFDVPPLKNEVKSCHLVWTPPTAKSFPSKLTGSKKVDFYAVTSEVKPKTLTWNNKPKRGAKIGTFDAATGTFTKSSVTCEFGKVQQFELVAEDNTEVEWFQENSPRTGLNYVMLR